MFNLKLPMTLFRWTAHLLRALQLCCRARPSPAGGTRKPGSHDEEDRREKRRERRNILTAHWREHQGIAAYQVENSGLLQKPVLDLALQFQGHTRHTPIARRREASWERR
jgi:hypothetical protein